MQLILKQKSQYGVANPLIFFEIVQAKFGSEIKLDAIKLSYLNKELLLSQIDTSVIASVSGPLNPFIFTFRFQNILGRNYVRHSWLYW